MDAGSSQAGQRDTQDKTRDSSIVLEAIYISFTSITMILQYFAVISHIANVIHLSVPINGRMKRFLWVACGNNRRQLVSDGLI